MKEKNTRSSKKKKTGAAVGTLAIAGLLALALGSGSFGLGFGGGNGDRTGAGSGSAASSPDAADVFAPSSVSSVSASSASDETHAKPQVSVIRIEGTQIFFDDTLCADENELRDLILPLGAERTYEFYYPDAIKGTYDKVRTVLTELSEALDLTILEP